MPRYNPIPPLDHFTDVIAESMVAFRTDSGYAEAMALAANRIQAKRSSHRARGDLFAASAAAVAQCRTTLPAFVCASSGVCGTKGCRFATGDLAVLEIEAKPGKDQRPQPHTSGPTYSVESGVKTLVALRTPSRRAV